MVMMVMIINNNKIDKIQGVRRFICAICKETVFNSIYILTCDKCIKRNICSGCIETVLLFRRFNICRFCITGIHILNITMNNNNSNTKDMTSSLRNMTFFTCLECKGKFKLIKSGHALIENHLNTDTGKYCKGSEVVAYEFLDLLNTEKIMNRRNWF